MEEPTSGLGTGILFFRGEAAGSDITNVRVNVKAEDPNGGTASTHVIFTVGVLFGPKKPSFASNVSSLIFESGEAVSRMLS